MGIKLCINKHQFNGSCYSGVSLNTVSKIISYAEPLLCNAYGKRQIEVKNPIRFSI